MFARFRSSRGTSLLVELLMIVVGINIALWFEGWFEDLREAETEREYLAGLSDDLRTDIEALDGTIANATAKLERLQALLGSLPTLPDAPAQQQVQAIFEPSGYWFFTPSDFTYVSMQESGDFRLLSNQEIKQGLLRQIRAYRYIETLQGNYLQGLDDEYIPLVMRSVDLATQRVTDPAVLENQVFLNFFAFAVQETDGRLEAYRKARESAAALLKSIEGELADSKTKGSE